MAMSFILQVLQEAFLLLFHVYNGINNL